MPFFKYHTETLFLVATDSDVSSSKATVPSAQLKNKLVAAAQQAEDDVFKQRAATIGKQSKRTI